MNEEEKKQFFATQSKPLNTVKMNGGKVSLANFPKEIKDDVMSKLAEKDPVMAEGQKGIIPGLLINGRQVTRDNIHEFEINKPKVKKAVKEEKKFSKEDLQMIADKDGLKGLRSLVKKLKLDIKFRGVKEAIREILKEL